MPEIRKFDMLLLLWGCLGFLSTSINKYTLRPFFLCCKGFLESFGSEILEPLLHVLAFSSLKLNHLEFGYLCTMNSKCIT